MDQSYPGGVSHFVSYDNRAGDDFRNHVILIICDGFISERNTLYIIGHRAQGLWFYKSMLTMAIMLTPMMLMMIMWMLTVMILKVRISKILLSEYLL